jgi:hypothetical protein
MLSWFHRRKERQQQVVRDADNLMALFGERAYFEALARAQHEDENGRDSRYWLAVRREIADRTGKEIGLDTATRYPGP